MLLEAPQLLMSLFTYQSLMRNFHWAIKVERVAGKAKKERAARIQRIEKGVYRHPDPVVAAEERRH